jgi:predicted nucleotidyltransferase
VLVEEVEVVVLQPQVQSDLEVLVEVEEQLLLKYLELWTYQQQFLFL